MKSEIIKLASQSRLRVQKLLSMLMNAMQGYTCNFDSLSHCEIQFLHHKYLVARKIGNGCSSVLWKIYININYQL